MDTGCATSLLDLNPQGWQVRGGRGRWRGRAVSGRDIGGWFRVCVSVSSESSGTGWWLNRKGGAKPFCCRPVPPSPLDCMTPQCQSSPPFFLSPVVHLLSHSTFSLSSLLSPYPLRPPMLLTGRRQELEQRLLHGRAAAGWASHSGRRHVWQPAPVSVLAKKAALQNYASKES